VLGKAAVYYGKNAVQTQSYGAEARGSLAKSEVIISDQKIGFPAVRRCDILVAMNQEALDKYSKDLKEDGMLIIDSTNVKQPETHAKAFKIPATENAERAFGTKVYANMLMLGALARATNIVSDDAIKKAIEDTVEQKYAKMNVQAYMIGKDLVQ
jgi:2-oxoglutarate ferredoxin oxidoreductase subunit gamma